MRVLVAAALLGGSVLLATPASASCIAIGDYCYSLPCVAGVYDEVREATGDKLPPEAFACTA